MLKRLLTYLVFGKSYCGMEYCINDGTTTLKTVLLERKKEALDISETFSVDSIAGIGSKISKNQHIHLTINSQQVLTKFVKGSFPDALKAVYKAFPNLNLDEFYYESLNQKEGAVVSVCRKEFVSGLLDSFKKEKKHITGVSLGPMAIGSILEYVPNGDIHIVENQALVFEGGEVLESRPNITDNYQTKGLDINGIQISENLLLALSGALQTLVPKKTYSNFGETSTQLTNEFKNNQYFGQFLKIGLGCILLLVLLNFMFFSHYFNKTNELSQLSQINQESKTTLLDLTETVSKKETMVEDLIKNGRSKSSFYINEIVSLLPGSILLEDINFQPLSKRIKAEETVQVWEHIIIMSGITTNGASVTQLVMALETKPWVEKVEILGFGSESNTNSTFNIKIRMVNGD